ncbi:S8 family serine peptidase, partial [bacterium]|nr:S8 family serine peptidase [bacterium]
VLAWLEKNKATLGYEDTRFGYVDAQVEWSVLEKLIETRGDLGLDTPSMLKLELETITTAEEEKETDEKGKSFASALAPAANSSFTGPVHSAGYGAKVREFREQAAKDLGKTVDDIAGQGILVSIFDGGIDLSRTDVYGGRLRDFVIGDERLWINADTKLEDFLKAESLKELPKELADLKDNKTLRFASLQEKQIGYNADAKEGYDLNGSGKGTDKLPVAVYQTKAGKWEARIRTRAKDTFSQPIVDYGAVPQKGQIRLLNLHTGKEYVRSAQFSAPSAGAFKFRADAKGEPQIALFGSPTDGADHGIANLHMVGGDYAMTGTKERLQGVAPSVQFIGAQTWTMKGGDYGQTWIPLARTILESVKQGADVLDLDIFTPGHRDGEGLLSTLLCRITSRTAVVPVVAAHNYAPLPNTIQSLAQSPCVLGIGAAHSRARLQLGSDLSGVGTGAVSSTLANDDSVETTFYSGRGFALNGLLKPDIITPAYGYTAYSERMTRFGGTSGATPATAGIVALLKQAARARGVELGLDQTRVLLQATSQDPGPQHVREGFGFTNLLAAWELFKKQQPAQGEFSLTPLRLGVPPQADGTPKPLFYYGLPNDRYVSVRIRRSEIQGSSKAPIPLRFTISYAGASAGTGIEWLKLYDPAKSSLTNELELDAPLEGEHQALRLYFELDPETWERLPAGDHIALVRAARSGLEGRPADFVLPVTITKGARVVNSRTFEIQPLYTDQIQTLAIESRPGDVLYISAQTQCQGERFTTKESKPESLMIAVDTQPFYPHVFQFVNSYRPVELSANPLRISAGKAVTLVSLFRRGPLACQGAVQGTVRVDRYAVQSQWTQKAWTGNDKAIQTAIDQTLEIPFDSRAEAADGTTPDGVFRINTQNPHWRLRRLIQGPSTITAPARLEEVRILPANSDLFQGLLTEFKPDGTHVQESTSSVAFSKGFGSTDETLFGDFQGIHLDGTPVGNLLSFVPAAAKQASVWQLMVEAPEANLQTQPASSRRNQEAVSPVRVLRFIHMVTLPRTLPDTLADFRGAEWEKYFEFEVELYHRTQAMPGIEVPERSLWRDRIRVSLP